MKNKKHMIHELKCWPEFFCRILCNQKRFDARKNDRFFEVGDLIVFKEYDPVKSDYTGKKVRRQISYILHGPKFGIEDGYCVLSLDDLTQKQIQ